MNKIFLVMVIALLFYNKDIFAQAAINFGDPQNLKKNETYYLILLGGQSNMVGSGKRVDIKCDYEFNTIFYYNFGMNQSFKISNKNFGPEIGISAELNRHFPDKKFILIKYAIGGASLLDWSPGYDKSVAAITGHPEFGAMYDSLMSKVELVTEGLSIKTTALVWMQGERDARIPEAGVNYYGNFKAFINSMRADLNSQYLPVIFGRINPPVTLYPAVGEVVQAQQRISEEVRNTYLIDTENLEKWSDDVHYSSVGQIELGHLFGKKIVEILQQKENMD